MSKLDDWLNQECRDFENYLLRLPEIRTPELFDRNMAEYRAALSGSALGRWLALSDAWHEFWAPFERAILRLLDLVTRHEQK